MCETGGARRTWLRGKEKINKRYLVQAAGFNLGLLMRVLFGVGKPRVLQGTDGAASCAAAKLGDMGRWLMSIAARIGRGMKTWWAAEVAAMVRRPAAGPGILNGLLMSQRCPLMAGKNRSKTSFEPGRIGRPVRTA